MKTNSTTLLLSLALTVPVALLGCERSRAAQGAVAANKTKAQQASPVAPAASTVGKILFVGKEHPCDCTKKALDAGWAALQQALGTPAKLPVERLAVDTEAAKVEPYRQQRPIMALPAIYFLDGKGTVLEMLQGEVTANQIVSVLVASRRSS
jgi:hypothetical protein